MIYELKGTALTVHYNPETSYFSGTIESSAWETIPGHLPLIMSKAFGTLPFSKARCSHEFYKTGTAEGVKAIYSDFPGGGGYEITTYVFVEAADDTLHCEFFVKGDPAGDIHRIFWPAPLAYNADNGYTVLPKMQGLIIPAKWPGEIKSYSDWQLMTRDYYMPFMGQVRDGGGYMMIFDTPYDANCRCSHTPGGDTYLEPEWRPSLGHITPGDRRKLIYTFYETADYNLFCKEYRRYLKERGRLITLKMKAAANPNINYLAGAGIYHTGAARMIKPGTEYYRENEPEYNNVFVPFSETGKKLEKVKALGFDKIYLHLDGWGKSGYDRQHPDVFPPNENCGGTEGMRALSEKCRDLGYKFGIHDQYRDYYLDANTYDEDNVAVDIDGKFPVYNVWYGGEQAFMCPELCPGYVRRNYKEFEKLGIQIDGSYLDVFSVVEEDECFNEKHTVTRKQCAEYRMECFDYLNSKGIIPSSEETVDAVLPSIALCHHSPFAVDTLGGNNREAMGIPTPLFSLVYHDCIVVPWFGVGCKGGWHIPVNDSGYVYALLTGGTIYMHENYNEIQLDMVRLALNLQEELFNEELVRHEFLDSGYRRQRTTFSNGRTVTVDFDSGEVVLEKNSDGGQ